MFSGGGTLESFRLDVGEGQLLVDAGHGMARDDLGEQMTHRTFRAVAEFMPESVAGLLRNQHGNPMQIRNTTPTGDGF
jgi:hypothetical protein